MANSIQAINLRRGFNRFVTWWLHELSLLVPDTWRYWYLGRDNILTVTLGAEQILFHRPQLSSLQEVGRLDLADATGDRKALALRCLEKITEGKTHRLYLCLPADKALRREIPLPIAAEENIRQTLEFELDRQTPFKPDQIYFDYKIIDRVVADQRLLVELIVLPKTVVEDQIRRAAMLGLPITAAVLEQDVVRDGDRSPNFLPALLQPKRSQRRVWLNLALFGLALALLAAAIVIPLWHKREQAITLSAMVMGAKDAAAHTDKLRTQLDELVAEHNFPIDKKNARVSSLVLLNELSKLFPDDTWVSQFDVNGVDLQIQGETGSSSKLIEVLENSGLVKGVSYKSPLTQIPGTAVERFHLAAETKIQDLGEKGIKPSAGDAADGGAPQVSPVSATTAGISKKDSKSAAAGGKP